MSPTEREFPSTVLSPPEPPASRRNSPRGIACVLAGLLVLPFAAWLIGSCIVHVTPPVYHGGAMVRVAADSTEGSRKVCEELRSGAVVEMAARTLAGSGPEGAVDPMMEYLLWSSLSVQEMAGSNLVKLEARSSRPGEAERMVVAVVDAYEKNARRTSPADSSPKALVYLAPMESEPARVSDEMRMMLGIAGFASICLLLCIPLLRYVEGSMPLRMKPSFFPAGPGATRTA